MGRVVHQAVRAVNAAETVDPSTVPGVLRNPAQRASIGLCLGHKRLPSGAGPSLTPTSRLATLLKSLRPVTPSVGTLVLDGFDLDSVGARLIAAEFKSTLCQLVLDNCSPDASFWSSLRTSNGMPGPLLHTVVVGLRVAKRMGSADFLSLMRASTAPLHMNISAVPWLVDGRSDEFYEVSTVPGVWGRVWRAVEEVREGMRVHSLTHVTLDLDCEEELYGGDDNED